MSLKVNNTNLHHSPPQSPQYNMPNTNVKLINSIEKRCRDDDTIAKETCAQFQQLTCDSLPHSPPRTPLGSLSTNFNELSTHADLSESHEMIKHDSALNLEQKPSTELNLKCFTLIRTLGTGSFGRVHLAKSKIDQSYYAIKVLKKTDIVQLKQVEHTKNERSILAGVKYSFIVNLWGTFQDDANLYMVLDYVPGGELFSLMRKTIRLSEDVAKFYAAEVLLSIAYLHSHNIIYRDLKPENLLLDIEGHIKITDFGFAKVVPDITWTLCGTPDYLAPEIIQSKGYGKPVDYWALGILIYEMLAGIAPFYDDNQFKLYEKIVACNPVYPDYFSDQVVDLLKHLLTSDLSSRYGNLKRGYHDITDHPWFSSIDFDKLAKRQLKPPFIPEVKGEGDASNFDIYDEERIPYGLPEPDPYRKYFTEF
ncbi:camp-dependent protein kinase 8 [Cokeromyces recurvatus]|uniref:camp-dependent protein kinase 8 n=1 Tax=Cokeromyces recurvatus TaxID=90255 RepID=UPI00221FAE34|nr:camp-dependent protein kinase 8 [Cokeromyces recurvatus]KAI7900784.1 camp-dependent protein kinase 8 [Cokeromyces recurvatus]